MERSGDDTQAQPVNNHMEDYLTLAEAVAQGYSNSVSTLRSRIKRGKMKGDKMGNTWVTKREWLKEAGYGVDK